MKIIAFSVHETAPVSFENVIEHLISLPLEDRLRQIETYSVRLEDAKKMGRRWALDFGAIRVDGPGRASKDTPIQDFDMTENEGFGHEAAMFYDPDLRFVTAQYNHTGPRPSAIQTYLYKFSTKLAGLAETEDRPDGTHAIAFLPVLKLEAAEKLNDMKLFKKIEISAYVPGLIESTPKGSRPSLGSILSHPVVGGGEILKIQVNAGRGRLSTLPIKELKEMVADLLGLRSELKTLHVIAKGSEDGPSEPVDLLEARLEADIPIMKKGRRYGRPERWSALAQCFDTWQSNGFLKK